MSRFLKPLGCVGMSGLLLLALPVAARAATITFTFNSCGTGGSTGVCTGSQTFTNGIYSITATAEANPGNTAGNLFAKNNGGDEVGLGLTSDPTASQDEITAGFYIQLQLSSSIPSALSLQMDSTTSPDVWEIYDATGTGTPVSLGSNILTGTNESPFSYNVGTDRFLDFTAMNGNVLLHSLSFNVETGPPPVPEPSGLALLGTGILGLVGVARRKLKV